MRAAEVRAAVAASEVVERLPLENDVVGDICWRRQPNAMDPPAADGLGQEVGVLLCWQSSANGVRAVRRSEEV